MELDMALKAAYPEFGVPTDRIVTDPSLSSSFANSVRQLVGMEVDEKIINQRLIQLRKRGEENGGLPKLIR